MANNLIILAAGKGSRMNSTNPNGSKVAAHILGKPMIDYVFHAFSKINIDNTFVVVGFCGEQTASVVGDRAKIVWQKEIIGTGNAVLQCKDVLPDDDGYTIVTSGDMPLLKSHTMSDVVAKHIKENNDLTLVTTYLSKTDGYGIVIREKPSTKIKEILNRRDCKPGMDYNHEINAGVYVIRTKLLKKYIDQIKPHKDNGHYFFTEIVKLFVDGGHKVYGYVVEDASEVYTVYDRAQLAFATKIIRKRFNNKLMLAGISIHDPDSTFISPDVEIGQDTVIHPNTIIMGNTIIGKGNIIGPSTSLRNVRMNDNNIVPFSYLLDTDLGSNNKICPFTKIINNKIVEDESDLTSLGKFEK